MSSHAAPHPNSCGYEGGGDVGVSELSDWEKNCAEEENEIR